MGFGKKLQEKMDRKGIKQIDLVNAVGIPKTTLSSMLSRDNTKVDIDVFLKICKVLDCSPEDFSEEIISAHEELPAPLRSDEKQLLNLYNSMNEEGKEKALERLEEMALLDRYKKRNQSEMAEEA